ncbi:MAG TPA: ATP-binding protein, partial [Desulfurivibrionaceae bacterium]|nr:ATP-binding protein [Desulfurivibrionaceae bacterium]
PLVLSRTGRYITTDELGMVVAAFNEMRENLLRDIEARQQADKTLQMLAESSAVLTGQELFDTIVRILCDFFHGECAILGELTAADTITARAMVLDGAMVNDFSYALAGSPCADVHQKGYCLFPERITSLFPSDQALITMGAEGYAGVPILGRDQQPLGILCVISRSKLRPPDRAEEIMRILQSRASAELERLRADLEKEKLEARLRQAQKMEAIGTLAGGIAHDFNNLLSPIIGYTEMAQLEMNGAEKERWKVEEVLRAALRAKDIVQQILTFSRQREQERTNLELQPVIKETLKLLRVSLPATIDIRQDVDPACGPVHADLTQMQQVVMNLCTNAFHAMSEQGGVLEVTLKEVTVSSEDRLGANPLTPGRYACLTVGDTGHGMDKATLERIFDPYFTTKEQGKGTGLGLALVHGIVKSHQGSVSVYSEPGQGALFKVYLPISKELAPTTAQAGPNNGSPLPGGNETVLLVDDEESLVRMATKMLEHLGYTVVGVTDSTEALALFRSQPQHYDLVITA